MKICKICGETNPNTFSQKGFYCRACCNIKQRAWQKAHPGYRGSGKLKRFQDRTLMQKLRQVRNTANGRSVCMLSDDFLFDLWNRQEGLCALSGRKMSLETNSLDVVSLDQIIPGKGYTEDNVQYLTWAVNRAKGEMPLEDLLTMCEQILRRCNDYPVREYSQAAGSAQPCESR